MNEPATCPLKRVDVRIPVSIDTKVRQIQEQRNLRHYRDAFLIFLDECTNPSIGHLASDIQELTVTVTEYIASENDRQKEANVQMLQDDMQINKLTKLITTTTELLTSTPVTAEKTPQKIKAIYVYFCQCCSEKTNDPKIVIWREEEFKFCPECIGSGKYETTLKQLEAKYATGRDASY